MEANKRRNIQSGEQYDHLFPSADGTNTTIRHQANVSHTVAFIPKVVHQTLHQTEKISRLLKGSSLEETCSNIWHFVYRHINYKKDEEGYEQIRSPARSWHDRKKGVDCDCYSVFISSILTNLGIDHKLRITKYHRDYFQHIYPIVPTNHVYITIDCVTDKFNYEVPYSEKKDYPMDLQYLSGLDDTPAYEENIAGADDELGRLLMSNLSQRLRNKMPKRLPKKKSKPAPQPSSNEPQDEFALPKPKKRKFGGKLLNFVNKINPATLLLRNGILAAMKLNIKNVAKRLRWSYLTPEQARKKGMDPKAFQKLVRTRMKLERIFYGAGGKVNNLKKAILKGKGNRDKAVNGVEGLGMIEIDTGIEYMDEYTPISQLLGTDIHYSENMEGLGQLGEPITLSSIAAASGVIAGIVGMLKQIGELFPKKTKESEDFDPEKNAEAEKQELPAPPQQNFTKEAPGSNGEEAMLPQARSSGSGSSSLPAPIAPGIENEGAIEPASKAKEAAADSPDEKPPGFWDKNKSWLKPVAIGVGVLTVAGIGYAILKPKQTASRSSPSNGKSLNGAPKRGKNHHRKTKHKNKKAVALL